MRWQYALVSPVQKEVLFTAPPSMTLVYSILLHFRSNYGRLVHWYFTFATIEGLRNYKCYLLKKNKQTNKQRVSLIGMLNFLCNLVAYDKYSEWKKKKGNLSYTYHSEGRSQPEDLKARAYKLFVLITRPLAINYAMLGELKSLRAESNGEVSAY